MRFQRLPSNLRMRRKRDLLLVSRAQEEDEDELNDFSALPSRLQTVSNSL